MNGEQEPCRGKAVLYRRTQPDHRRETENNLHAISGILSAALCAILAFQPLQDLADCPADLDAESVKGSVMENCAVQISYAIKDPVTAEWLSKSTGTVLVDDESRKIEKNIALSETFENERSVRMAERYYIDTNMFMNLPKSCGVLSIPGNLARFCPPRQCGQSAHRQPLHPNTLLLLSQKHNYRRLRHRSALERGWLMFKGSSWCNQWLVQTALVLICCRAKAAALAHISAGWPKQLFSMLCSCSWDGLY